MTVVARHPSGGLLSIGSASSVTSLLPTRDVVVVDVKQEPIPVEGIDVISHPMSDDHDGIADLEAFGQLLGQIDRLLSAGKTVHVVCALGQSRSATVVSTYVAAKLGIDIGEAIALIRYTYPDANPNPAFRDQSRHHADTFAGWVEASLASDTPEAVDAETQRIQAMHDTRTVIDL